MFNLNQNGRSMVEMLGVLAIIGILSIGSIAGFRYALLRYKANEVLDSLSKLYVLVEEKSKFTDNSNPTASVNYTELDKSIMDSPLISNEPMDWGPRIPRLEMIYSPFDMPFEHCYGVTVMHLAQDSCEIITMAQTIAPEKIIEIDCSDYPYTAYFDYGNCGR